MCSHLLVCFTESSQRHVLDWLAYQAHQAQYILSDLRPLYSLEAFARGFLTYRLFCVAHACLSGQHIDHAEGRNPLDR